MKTAVLAWGRMNPITRAHLAMIKFAKQQGEAFVYLSHSQDAKKNPLPYDRKIYWAQLAAGDTVVKSNAKVIIQALQEIQAMGYTDLIYVCGSDRKNEMEALLNKYNGVPDKSGVIQYKFNSIEVRKFGNDRLDEDIPLERCSASFARECVRNNDLDTFKQIVPFDEEDAVELFEELKKCMGLNESLIEAYNTPEDREFKKYIGSIFSSNGIKMSTTSPSRDPDDFIRVQTTPNVTEEDIINILKDNEENNESFIYSVINYDNYPGASKTYKAVKLNYNNKNYFISIANRAKKLYTPNKVLLNATDRKIEFNEVEEHIQDINGIKFKEMYHEAINSVNDECKNFIKSVVSKKSTQTELRFSGKFDGKLIEDLDRSTIPSIMNDFGEILGAGCLAKSVFNTLQSKTTVEFPSASNKPLVDYSVECKKYNFEVSEKAGSGAAPTCESAFKKLYPGATSNSNVDQFIRWMYENVATKGMHQGFINLADLAIGNFAGSDSDWYVGSYNMSLLKYAFKPNSITKDNIDKFVNDCERLYNTSLRYERDRANKHQQYCETIRVRYLARGAIRSINNNSKLMLEFNKLFKLSLGSFIQVHLVSSINEFISGIVKFKAVTISDGGEQFMFLDTSVIDSSNKLGGKRLSMKLKQ